MSLGRRLVFAAMIVLVVSAAPLHAGELYVAFWNVENLFDIYDDPKVSGDEEFTPRGPKRYDLGKYKTRLRNLAKVIRAMNKGKGPDILGLCEVENHTVVKDLIAELGALGRSYRYVHKDSRSSRGIDCALIYDQRKVKLKKQKFIFVNAGRTRDIVLAQFRTDNKTLYVFVNHWPSRRSDQSYRIRTAQTLRRQLDAILKTDPAADMIVMGDLNDEPANDSVRKHLRTWGDPKTLRGSSFYNTVEKFQKDPKQGTHVYDNRWLQLDHIIVSPGMLDKKGYRWERTEIVREKWMLFVPNNRRLIARPNRAFSGPTFHRNGYSDHLPVACVIRD